MPNFTIATKPLAILTFLILLCSVPSLALSKQPDLGQISVHDLLQQTAHWTILDARPFSKWQNGHIPGALSFSWADHTATVKGVKYRTFLPESYASILGRLGIDESTPIIVYGDADSSWGGEGWVCWLLSWIGHKGPVRLLTGGIQAWEAEHLRLTKKNDKNVQKMEYRVETRPELNFSADELKKTSQQVILIDTRSTWEWYLGHLPDAVHIPWNEFFQGKDHRPISPDDYTELLRSKGIDPNRKTIFYCVGGIRSAYAWLIHRLSGFSNGANFEGGTEEWKKAKQDER